MKNYIERPIAFSLLIAAILISGVLCFFILPIKMYPDMVKPGFNVSFGNSDIGIPEEMRKRYGRAIDEQLQKLKGLEKYEVTYYPTWSRIRMEFEWDSDDEKLKQEIENVFIPLKEANRGKFWYNVRTSSGESSGNLMVSVGHKSLSGEQLFEFLRQTINRDIGKLDQVEAVNTWGWQGNKLFLEIDMQKMMGYGLSLDDIVNSVNTSANHMMAGKLIEGEQDGKSEIQIDIPANLKDIYQVLELPLHRQGRPLNVKLKHVANLKEEFDSSSSIFRLNGDNATFMSVILKSTGDVKRTCDKIIGMVEKFAADNPDITHKVIVNPAKFVENSMQNLLLNALIGGIVAILIVFLFLGSFANTFIIAISIPFCLVSSFILMKIFNISINIISLGGMAIGVGMILDSSIVVLENIWRLKKDEANKDKSRINIILSSVKEVTLPIIMSVLTSVVVFLPILFTASYTKAILGDLAKMVIFTLLLSIPASLIVVPILSYRFMPEDSKPYAFLSIWDKLNALYLKSLNWMLRKRKRIIGFTLASFTLFIGSLFLFPLVKKEIVAVPTTKLLAVRMGLPDNQDLAFTLKKVKEVEDYLNKKEEITTVATAMWNPDNGYIIATLNSRHDFEPIKEEFNKAFPRNPSMNIHAHKWDPGKMPLPNEKDFIISITSESLDSILETANILSQNIPHAKFNFNQKPWKQSSENIQVNFNPWLSFQVKNSAQKLLQAATKRGLFLGEFFSEGRSKQVSVRFLNEQRAKYLEEMQNLPLLLENKMINLKSLADIKFNQEESKPIRLVDGRKAYDFIFWTKADTDKEKEIAKNDLKKKIKNLQIPSDVNISYPSPNVEMDKSIGSFKFSLVLSIGLVFLVIALMFNSIKLPLIILATIPLAIIGVGSGLYLWGSTLSLNSMLGTILLSGLVVNNAIILLDFYKSQPTDLSVKQRISNAASLRLRPILMSTLTTLLGVFPVALGMGEGGEVLAPLGVSIFSGLIFSTVFCLFFIPGIMVLLNKEESVPA
jgi:HAE1 family hydrophobic/amphiphilic exporter-1